MTAIYIIIGCVGLMTVAFIVIAVLDFLDFRSRVIAQREILQARIARRRTQFRQNWRGHTYHGDN